MCSFARAASRVRGVSSTWRGEDGPHCRAVHVLLDNVVHHFWCALLWGFPGPSQCLQPQICLTPAHCFDSDLPLVVQATYISLGNVMCEWPHIVVEALSPVCILLIPGPRRPRCHGRKGRPHTCRGSLPDCQILRPAQRASSVCASLQSQVHHLPTAHPPCNGPMPPYNTSRKKCRG